MFFINSYITFSFPYGYLLHQYNKFWGYIELFHIFIFLVSLTKSYICLKSMTALTGGILYSYKLLWSHSIKIYTIWYLLYPALTLLPSFPPLLTKAVSPSVFSCNISSVFLSCQSIYTYLITEKHLAISLHSFLYFPTKIVNSFSFVITLLSSWPSFKLILILFLIYSDGSIMSVCLLHYTSCFSLISIF